MTPTPLTAKSRAAAGSRLVAALIAVVTVLAAAPAAIAAEPRLRPAVEVDSGQVRLGDLFENAGPRADEVVMAAPEPGQQFLLSLDQAFDIANARQLGWQPVAPFEHVVITRAWRALDRHEIEDAVRDALHAANAGDQLSLELATDTTDVTVARGAIVDIWIEGMDYSGGSGRFRATLVVQDGPGEPQRHPLAGRAYAITEVPVLSARLRSEDVIGPSDVVMKTVRADHVPGDVATGPKDLIGLSPKRTLTPGKPVQMADVGPPVIVRKGALLTMTLTTERMQLTATGRALDSGSLGDVVRAMNVQSKLVVEAVVIGPNRVSAQPGAHQIAAR